jgi:hypothetical protein
MMRVPDGPGGECAAPAVVHEVLRSPGRQLEPGVRAEMETRFGHDFSHVRVHTDERGAASARAVGALAYTIGRDVVFDTGRYAPASVAGRRLLAHELTHVAQQNGTGEGAMPLRVARDDDPAEAEAEALAGTPVPPGRSAPPHLLLRDRPKHSPSPGAPHDPARLVSAGIWEQKTPCISVIAPDERYAHEREDLSGEDLFSKRCPLRICAGEQVPFEFIFHVDAVEQPRVQPFTNPSVAVTVDFAPSGEGGDTRLLAAEGEGAYQGAGERLDPSFGMRPAIVPPEAGTLYLSAAISDPDSGQLAVYGDMLPVVECPKPSSAGGGFETKRWIVVPDPDNAPLDYYLFGPTYPYVLEEDTGEPPPFEVWHDDEGDYYIHKGRKVRLPEEL